MNEVWKVVQMDYISSIIILPASLFYQELNFVLDLGVGPHLFNSYYMLGMG